MLISLRLFDSEGIYMPVNITNHTALDSNIATRFTRTARIETIISGLMLEDWSIIVDHRAHFDKCHPKLCKYVVTQKAYPIFIITSVIGFTGGLSVALRILVPFFVTLLLGIHRECRFRRDSRIPNQSKNRKFNTTVRKVFNHFQNLNVYNKPQTNGDQILATRIYYSCLAICIVLVSYFASTAQNTHSPVLVAPSESQVAHLRSNYAATLACPCTRISIPYNTFIGLSVVMHPICSSVFVSSNWSGEIYKKGGSGLRLNWFLLSTHFLLLSSLCDVAKNVLSQTTSNFLTSEWIRTDIISENAFSLQTAFLIKNFIEQVARSFKQQLSMISDTWRSNQLIDQSMSAWGVEITNETKDYIVDTVLKADANKSCICASGVPSCSTPLVLLDQLNRNMMLNGKNGY